MDPKFLEELQKLKEQKNSDLNKIDLGQLSIPDFEDVEIPEDDFTAETDAEFSGGTIKFQRVSPDESKKTAPPSGGRRGRKPVKPEKPVVDKATRKRRAKIRNTVLISVASALAVVVILFAVFFGVRNANQKNYTYQYWGMGIAIENGVNSYSFFGNLKEITQYGQIGQIEAVAEFEKGNCIKETVYTPEGDVDYYYAHEYDDDTRIISSYHEDGQMVKSVKYTVTKEGKIQAETTYHLEENRVETAILTLNENGNVLLTEFYADGILTLRQTYDRTLITEEIYYDEEKIVTSRVVYEYNDKKQLLTQTEYDANNTIQRRTVNQYNEKNLLTKTIQYNGAGDILEYDTYNYDLNNNPIKQVNYAGDGTMQSQILKVFNAKNRVTKETSLKSDGSIVYCYGYDYDEKGYVSKSIVYNTKNSTVIDQYTLFTRNKIGTVIESNTHNSGNILVEKALYNDGGFLTELYQFNDSGILLLEQKSKYDEKQRLTQKSITNFSDSGEKISYFSEQYNEKGLVTVRINESIEESLYEQLLFAYHKDGWKEQETLFDKSGKTVYDRTYDSQERIISETLFENGREITYNEYTYNDKNQITLKKSLDPSIGLLTETDYTYNNEGILTMTLDSIANKLIVKKQYSEDGLVTIQTNYDNGYVDSYCLFEYDSNDRVIVQERYRREGGLIDKTIYYYREDGGRDYTLYDEFGVVIEDSRGPEFLPEEEPDHPDDDPTTDEPVDDTATTDASVSATQSNSTSIRSNSTTDSATNSVTDPTNSRDTDNEN